MRAGGLSFPAMRTRSTSDSARIGYCFYFREGAVKREVTPKVPEAFRIPDGPPILKPSSRSVLSSIVRMDPLKEPTRSAASGSIPSTAGIPGAGTVAGAHAQLLVWLSRCVSA